MSVGFFVRIYSVRPIFPGAFVTEAYGLGFHVVWVIAGVSPSVIAKGLGLASLLRGHKPGLGLKPPVTMLLAMPPESRPRPRAPGESTPASKLHMCKFMNIVILLWRAD